MRGARRVGWVFAVSLGYAALAAQNSAPILTPHTSTLIVHCDLDCGLTVDGAARGSIAANGTRRVVVPWGHHTVTAVSSDGRDTVAQELDAREYGERDVALRLGPAREARIAREKLAAGTIVVSCDIACYVTLDDRMSGDALPAGQQKRISVAPGRHILHGMEPDGQDNTSLNADVQGGAETPVTFALAPLRDARVEKEKEAQRQKDLEEQQRRKQEARERHQVTKIRELPGKDISAVVFSPDGKTLITGERDYVKFWDPASGQLVRSIESVWGRPPVALSPDGRRIAVATENRSVTVLDAASGQAEHELSDPHSDWIKAVAFSPDGLTLVVISADESDRLITLWNVATGKLMRSLTPEREWLECVAYSPDGRTVALGHSENPYESQTRTSVWDVKKGSKTHALKELAHALAFSPDGRMLASADSQEIRLWDVGSWQQVRKLTGLNAEVRDLAFSPDGRTLAAACGDKTIRLWDVAGGQLLTTIKADNDYGFTTVAFSPDGKVLASAGFTAELWDLSTLR